MIQRLGNLLLIVALLVGTGGHWALLQSLAWTTMLASHLQSQSLAEAMTQTFDGRHPCKLCCAICAGKQAEKKTEFPLSHQKIEFPPAAPRLALYPPADFAWLRPRHAFADSPAPPPPTPPPRINPG